MELDLKWPLLALTSLLLLVLQGMVNNSLNGWGLHLLLSGVIPVMPALWLRLRSGLVLMALCALYAAATLPTGPGFQLFFFCGCFALIHPYRVDIIRGRAPRILAAALVSNLALFIGHFIWALPQGGLHTTFWLRNGTDLVLSSLILLPVGYWFISLQKSLLEMTHARPAK